MTILSRRLRLSGIAAAAVAGLALSVPAGAARAPETSHAAPTAGFRQVCPTPTHPGQMACLSLIRSGARDQVRPDLINPSAYRPADLRQAYNLVAASKDKGEGMTVAVVDAGADPNAAKDLATYRKEWGLPACDSTTGAGCVTQLNEHAKTSPLPVPDPSGGWELEESLDLDMVSAICPNCRVVLVEANLVSDGLGGYTVGIADLSAAEDAAVSSGAKFVSNSWGGSESPGLSAYDSFFRHPGVVITVAAGDAGYGASYPATTPFVTSVGGTSLAPAKGTSRGWTETVWHGTGSGCSAIEAKPPWQTVDDASPDGCLNRTDNDVAADADPSTGVWIYDTYPYEGENLQWQPIGGTSAASPIIAAVYALAGPPKPDTYPASYLYQTGHSASLYQVTSGSNGDCETYRAYLCHGKAGYNGPAGLGTPDGTAAFTSTVTGHTISMTDPGTQDVAAGATVKLTLQAVDSAGSKLTYTAHNLPRGLSVTSSGVISGTLPNTPETDIVRVTASDASGATGSASFRYVIVPDLAAGYHRTSGAVSAALTSPAMCLDDAGDGTKNGTRVEFLQCATSAAQEWAFVPDAAPDGRETLQINGKCLDLTGTGNNDTLQISTCDGAAGEEWSLEQGPGTLWNPASDKCLTEPDTLVKTPVDAEIYECRDEVSTFPYSYGQQFHLPAGPVLSAIGTMCADDPGNSATLGTAVQLQPCDGSSAEAWDDLSDFLGTPSGLPSTHNGLCLTTIIHIGSNGIEELLEGAPVEVNQCFPSKPAANTLYLNGDWITTTRGEIFNTDTGQCLADPGSATTKGAKLALEDCDGDAGEIWAAG
jgi:hypothetical protein